MIINGGGLVGSLLACALGNHPLKIAIIDKKAFKKTSNNQDTRGLALSHTSIRCLKTLDLWSRIEKTASPLREVHISKKGTFGLTRIKAKEMNLENLGAVVNADHLTSILNESALSFSNVTVLDSDEIVDFTVNQTCEVNVGSQKKLTTQLLVAADGMDSKIRKEQGIGAAFYKHPKVACVVNLEISQSHQGIAYERFTEQGSIALLPFGEQRIKCVWILPINEASKAENENDEDFLKAVQASFGFRLGRLKLAGKRSFYPLSTLSADSLYAERLVLIGNAANTLNPVAAQGFNLGLRDAATLAEKIINAHQKNEDIGSQALLREYAKEREIDHKSIHQMIKFIEEPSTLQTLGILTAAWLPPFKRLVAKRGLGLHVNLPKLCRGVTLKENA